MNREELLKYCKSYGIKGVTKLPKEKLELLVKDFKRKSGTGYRCPMCEKGEVLEIDSEYVCEYPDCKFDKTPNELFHDYAERRLKRIEK